MTFTMTVWRTHAHLRRGAGSGEDWAPGQRAEHKSLSAFQQELQEKGISLFISKIKKILITGGCWTTARSREIQELYFGYISEGLQPGAAVNRIAAKLKISKVSVSVNLPYSTVVYKLEERSRNARWCERYRAKRTASYALAVRLCLYIL